MSEVATIKDPCPTCGKEMEFPETATEVVCPHCNARFNLVDEPTPAEQTEALGGAPATPPPPPPPLTSVHTDEAPNSKEKRAAVDQASSTPLPLPVAAPAPPPSAPAAPPAQLPNSDSAISADDGEAGPEGAGDVTHAKRGGGRKPIALAPKPDGVTDFIHRTREFQWVAKGGLGNPYGPTSVSTLIFEIVAEHGEEGIDPVDLAVELRKQLLEGGRDCRSILQRIVMVCERVCCSPHVGLMERVGETEIIRVIEKHRITVPEPPSDMVGIKRRRELDAARTANAALSAPPPPPPAPVAPPPA